MVSDWMDDKIDLLSWPDESIRGYLLWKRGVCQSGQYGLYPTAQALYLEKIHRFEETIALCHISGCFEDAVFSGCAGCNFHETESASQRLTVDWLLKDFVFIVILRFIIMQCFLSPYEMSASPSPFRWKGNQILTFLNRDKNPKYCFCHPRQKPL